MVSGIWHEGKWYPHTGFVCRRCGKPVYASDLSQYSYQCFQCDEDLFGFEVEPEPNFLRGEPMPEKF